MRALLSLRQSTKTLAKPPLRFGVQLQRFFSTGVINKRKVLPGNDAVLCEYGLPAPRIELAISICSSFDHCVRVLCDLDVL